jgi:hypothetical protein
MMYLTLELVACLEILYEILDDLEDLRIALEKETEPIPAPPLEFDPLQTFGKYT